MARLITSAMNQAGTWQDQPNDQANLLAYQTNQRNHEDDWRKQLAMAQLAQNQHQFDATNAQQNDQFNKSYAMQDGLAAAQINENTFAREDRAGERKDANDRYGKQFDYMSGRDKMNDDFRGKAFDLGNARYEQERTDNEPYRAAAARRMLAGEGLDKQQSDLMAMDLEDRKAERTRRSEAAKGLVNLPPLSAGAMDPEVSNEYQRNLAEMSPAEAGRIRDQRLSEKKATAASDPEFVANVQQARRALSSMIDNSTFGNWWKTRVSGLGDADRAEVENKIQPAIASLVQKGWKENVAREAVLRQLQDAKGNSLFSNGSGVFGTNEAAIDLNKHLGLTGAP